MNAALLQHPLSAAFPAMSEEQFDALKDSICDIGVQEPITLFEGMVLDGWHRWNAANALGVDCPTVDLGDVDPQSFVVAKNKARRHITQSQLAAAVVAVYGWRPVAGRPQKNSAPGAEFPKTTKEMAEIAGVGTRTIERAKVVEAKATPEVKAAVKAGEMSVKKAAETVAPPKEKAPAPVIEHSANDDMAEAAHTIGELSEEVEQLKAQIAVGGLPTADQPTASEIIEALRAEVKSLNAELDAMRISRDSFQRENRELLKQLGMNARELKKLRVVS